MLNKLISLKAKEIDGISSICESLINMLTNISESNAPSSTYKYIMRNEMNKIFESLEKHKDDNSINEWVKSVKRILAVDNLGLFEALERIKCSKEARSYVAVNKLIHEWTDRLSMEKEIFLIDNFIQDFSKHLYVSDINESIGIVAVTNDGITPEKEYIKILDRMKNSMSSYLFPYVEEDIEKFLNDKSLNNMCLVRTSLEKFAYDPIVHQLLTLVCKDTDAVNLGYSDNVVESVFSPILYVGENETIFAVNEHFYSKRGNTINKLDPAQVKSYNQEFYNLCAFVNSSGVEINHKNMSVMYESLRADIHDDHIIYDGKKYTHDEIKECISTYAHYPTNKSMLMQASNFLLSNKNMIGEVDFAKHVSLKGNSNVTADLFRLRDNIFINIKDPRKSVNRFYKNIPSSAAKNLMKEHLNQDISTIYKNFDQDDKHVRELYERHTFCINIINDINEKLSSIESLKTEKYNEEYREMLSDREDVINEKKAIEIEIQSLTDPNYIPVNEMEITVKTDDGQIQTVILPTNSQTSTTGLQQNVTGQPSVGDNIQEPSPVTFDQDQSANIVDPEVDLPIDVEAKEKEADEAEKESEENKALEQPEGASEPEQDLERPDGTTEPEVTSDEEKSKKVFLKREKNKDVTESVKGKHALRINESAKPSDFAVLDEVRLKGKRGRVIGKKGDGNCIVLTSDGRTELAESKALTLIRTTRSEEGDVTHMKFDKITQKLLNEQYANCGLYFNGRVCYDNDVVIKYSDLLGESEYVSGYKNGEVITVKREDARLHESDRSFSDISSYMFAYVVNEGVESPILANLMDMSVATNGISPVRVIDLTNPGDFKSVSYGNIAQSGKPITGEIEIHGVTIPVELNIDELLSDSDVISVKYPNGDIGSYSKKNIKGIPSLGYDGSEDSLEVVSKSSKSDKDSDKGSDKDEKDEKDSEKDENNSDKEDK